jgi:hypothetical protein
MSGRATETPAAMTRNSQVLILALVLLVIGAGCASGGAVVGPLRHWRISASTGLPSQVLPIFAYLQSPAQGETFEQAYDIEVAQCMAKWGYSDPRQVSLSTDTESPMYRRYGITSLAVASRWGYHLQPGSSPATSKTTVPMSDAESAVYLGTRSRAANSHYSPLGNGKQLTVAGKLVPPGGCAGAALVRLRAYGAGSDPELPAKINQDDSVASQNNPAVIRVFSAWSKCMVAKGYTLSNPLQAGDNFNIETPGPSQKEIDVAVADVRCKDQAQVISTWFGVEYQLQEASIQNNFAALSAIRAKIAQEQRAALAVITSAKN